MWPELLIISWSTVTADKAAAAFATGFYTYLGQHCTSTARASKVSPSIEGVKASVEWPISVRLAFKRPHACVNVKDPSFE